MQSVCKVRSRLEGFLGPFFLATAGILATGLQRHGGTGHHRLHEASTRLHWALWRHRTSRGFTRLHGGAGHHGASLDSLDLATRATSATALATALATGFSSNSYVFL